MTISESFRINKLIRESMEEVEKGDDEVEREMDDAEECMESVMRSISLREATSSPEVANIKAELQKKKDLLKYSRKEYKASLERDGYKYAHMKYKPRVDNIKDEVKELHRRLEKAKASAKKK